MPRVVRRWAGPLTGMVLLTTAACSGDGPAAPATRPTGTSAAAGPEQAVRDECRSTLPADAEIRPVTLAGAT